MKTTKLLVGDIGGTNIRLAVFSYVNGELKLEREDKKPLAQAGSFIEVAAGFLQDQEEVEQACFAVAGTILGRRVKVTNASWVLDAGEIEKTLGISKVDLINDISAIAYLIPALKAKDYIELNPGEALDQSPIGIVAPGTGLGEGIMFWAEDGYHAVASEGGHADFAPVNALQVELYDHLAQKFGHVSYERICSGIGVKNIYDFLVESGRFPEPDWLGKALQGHDDPAAVIFEAAQDADKECKLCECVVDLFVDVLAAESGNMALKILARGGIYIGGGIPPRITAKLEERFMKSFIHKGRFGEFLHKVPVKVIMHPNAGLYGAANYAAMRIAK